jgi:acyl-CoA thioesterase-1
MVRSSTLWAAACAAVLLVSSSCGSNEREGVRTGAQQRGEGSSVGTVPRAGGSRPLIVVLGDSLTAGLGLTPPQAYPALLQQRVDQAGFVYEVVNAGVSGDTSAGGLRRLDWSLTDDVRVLIVALGANDGLRGLPVDQLRRNLEHIIMKARAKKIAVILAGMEAPPNFGRSYTDEFRQVYPSLAKEYGVPIVPFLLGGVAGTESMNQRDGIHPTAEGARVLADNVWAVLEPVLADPKVRATTGADLKADLKVGTAR